MRLYTGVLECVRETERDLWEMGIRVHPQTMQDKDVHDDANYKTVEVSGYGFKIVNPSACPEDIEAAIRYLYPDTEEADAILAYIEVEMADRVGGVAKNPGSAWKFRSSVWHEFMHDGKFAYTYSERIAPQLSPIIHELRIHPETRQAIIEVHSNAMGDISKMGGVSRIPCSMYYQFMVREGRLDTVYTMRSCDFLTHWLVDIICAFKLGEFIAHQLAVKPGNLTYFTGSLHAYYKDMRKRGIF